MVSTIASVCVTVPLSRRVGVSTPARVVRAHPHVWWRPAASVCGMWEHWLEVCLWRGCSEETVLVKVADHKIGAISRATPHATPNLLTHPTSGG